MKVKYSLSVKIFFREKGKLQSLNVILNDGGDLFQQGGRREAKADEKKESGGGNQEGQTEGRGL